jgi:ABC-2 type transport system permease protein
MRKLWTIGRKDLVVLFRDRAALILMLAAPLALTVGLGIVTGSFSGGGQTGLRDIPLIVVNLDQGLLGEGLVAILQDDDLQSLLEPVFLEDPAEARRQVDEDAAAAAILIPQAFSAGILPDASGNVSPPAAIEVVQNPGRPTSAAIIASIVNGYLLRLQAGEVGAQVVVSQLVGSGRMLRQEIPIEAPAIGRRLATDASTTSLIRIESDVAAAEAPASFNPLAYIAPAMALLFLMYTVGMGARSLLLERDQGTLARLRASPTGESQVLGGKLFGTYLTGVAQLAILIAATTLLFRLEWGSPLGVAVLILAASAGATGWGALLAAVTRTPAQVGSIGAALMLSFGILGGSFFSVELGPPLLQALARLTPNYWGLQGFTVLASGAPLADLAPPVAALWLMGLILFIVAVLVFRRAGAARR